MIILHERYSKEIGIYLHVGKAIVVPIAFIIYKNYFVPFSLLKSKMFDN